MLWIDYAGLPVSFGTIAAGKSFSLSNEEGDVWRLVDQKTQHPLGIYKAKKGDGVFVIEGSVKDEDADGGNDNPKNEADGQPAPEGKKPHVFVRDSNIWISTDQDNNEYQAEQLSFGGVEQNPYDKDKIFLSPDGKFAVAWQFVPQVERKIHWIRIITRGPAPAKAALPRVLQTGRRRPAGPSTHV